MYHKIHVDKLSNAQISKLLNGGRIRVKAGRHHAIHVSSEQHKKIHKAHLKGAGVTIEFDPYQMEEHHHLRSHCGDGIRTRRIVRGRALMPAGYGMCEDDMMEHEYGGSMFGKLANVAKSSLIKEGKFLAKQGVNRAAEFAKDSARKLAQKGIQQGADFVKSKISGAGARGRPARRGRGLHKLPKHFARKAIHSLEKLAPLALSLL